MRAKARKTRWEEEQVILVTEMKSSIQWFRNEQQKWLDRADLPGLSKGHVSYAKRQANTWGTLLKFTTDDLKSLVPTLN